MKKVILNLAVSLDGFIEGPNGEVDWCIMDDEMGFDAFIDSIDTIFYGRVSYELWGNYQPGSDISEAEKSLWNGIRSKDKFVFSRSESPYQNATVISEDLTDKVRQIKSRNGKDIWLYGGAGLTKTFIQLGLVDEYRISVHPVVLGSGKPLFEDINSRIGLTLIDTRVFKSGVIEVVYETC
ncbi:dihydrofolate reductase [Dyadobacter luteus]|jgi:dihydrofolate reductase|uniref:Dihydrofolate reductase n=1 Tax=Dyadobacter luteus TaxID=2259619 RepID=A0A3D8Y6S3_9BACT|nr:dihydrofolate reductase family protein [Dyadobacter luteus]REA58023.1 dihydrofolate reductase [Dyadobacter luteus]